jgi:hypothetical protein
MIECGWIARPQPIPRPAYASRWATIFATLRHVVWITRVGLPRCSILERPMPFAAFSLIPCDDCGGGGENGAVASAVFGAPDVQLMRDIRYGASHRHGPLLGKLTIFLNQSIRERGCCAARESPAKRTAIIDCKSEAKLTFFSANRRGRGPYHGERCIGGPEGEPFWCLFVAVHAVISLRTTRSHRTRNDPSDCRHNGAFTSCVRLTGKCGSPSTAKL